jgi:hypothetical protein
MSELERLKVLSALKHGQNFINGRNTTAHEQKNMEDAIKIIESTKPVDVDLGSVSVSTLPTEDEIVDTILSCVDIRGIELEHYRRQFTDSRSGLITALNELYSR